ncbi:MAG: hypothetical protein GC205_11155 [Bacteroidetes bacterium]|nr:hypothetical protein [Bacteroidota bacterium]
MSVRTLPSPLLPGSLSQAAFQMEQSPSQLRLRSRQVWDRIRLMDTAGKTLRESSQSDQAQWELDGLPDGIFWVVAEWSGARSSRAVVIG